MKMTKTEKKKKRKFGLSLYCGGWISLTLNFCISTSSALSHLNETSGPPHVIIWSGSPPHFLPSLPKPPSSVKSYTFFHWLLLSTSSHISNFTTLFPFWLKSYTTTLCPTHLPSIGSVEDFEDVKEYPPGCHCSLAHLVCPSNSSSPLYAVPSQGSSEVCLPP